MDIIIEKRGSYNVNTYKLEVTADMRKKAMDFATEIIMGDDQYSRLLPIEVLENGTIEEKQKIEIQRTYVGKIGEIVFSKFLEEMQIEHSTEGMLEIYEGQENVDDFDFETKSHETIDIKTGFRYFHKLLLINTDQFDNNHKDYYVAIKLNAEEIDKENSEKKLVNWDSITNGIIEGYAEYDFLRMNAPIEDKSEGLARVREYKKLLGIDFLLRKMK